MHAIEKIPEFVCLSCGEGVLGPIARPFDAHNFKVCDMCGRKKMTLAANVYQDYERIFHLDEPLNC